MPRKDFEKLDLNQCLHDYFFFSHFKKNNIDNKKKIKAVMCEFAQIAEDLK